MPLANAPKNWVTNSALPESVQGGRFDHRNHPQQSGKSGVRDCVDLLSPTEETPAMDHGLALTASRQESGNNPRIGKPFNTGSKITSGSTTKAARPF